MPFAICCGTAGSWSAGSEERLHIAAAGRSLTIVRMTTRLDTVIETERLVLRVPRATDLEGLVELMTDEEAARYLGKAQPPPVIWRGLAMMAGSWVISGFGMFSVVEKASGRWVGRVGPWQPLGWPGTEVGWSMIRSVWGKGYAYEASVAAMDFAVDVLGWSDIIHSIHPDNTRSQTLAARLGSVNRGPGQLPQPYESDTVEIWGQTSAQWKKDRPH
jgi:RimJ/RimL family protein N-acetyltransferase